VLGTLDARFALAPARRAHLRVGARLAISVEPAGGSPSGAPTGPVILIGEVRTIS
jgi:anti-sigma-K factor RskA